MTSARRPGVFVSKRACLGAAALVLAAIGLHGALAGSSQRPAIELRLPPDLVLDAAADSPAAVVFRHTSHAALTGNRCLVCHPQPFSILGRRARVRHEEMNLGRLCGTCHNGRDASGVEDAEACFSCHTGVAGAEP